MTHNDEWHPFGANFYQAKVGVDHDEWKWLIKHAKDNNSSASVVVRELIQVYKLTVEAKGEGKLKVGDWRLVFLNWLNVGD